MNTKKALVALVVMICLTWTGCLASVRPTPSGCEQAAVYKTGFIPLGPVVVRSGLYSLAVLRPEAREVILTACNLAQGAVARDSLVEALRFLAVTLAGHSGSDPALKIVVFSALNTLDAVTLYPGAATLALNDCDREVLLSLFNNIRADVEGLR